MIRKPIELMIGKRHEVHVLLFIILCIFKRIDCFEKTQSTPYVFFVRIYKLNVERH